MKFEFENPTHLVFGAGTLSQIGEVVPQVWQKSFACHRREPEAGRCRGDQNRTVSKTGNDNVHHLSQADLCTTNSEISSHTPLEHV